MAQSARYGAVRFSAYALDADRAVLVAPDSRELVEMARAAAHILPLCEGFRTLEDHAAAIAQAGRLSDPAMVQPALRAFVDAGLLQEQSTLIGPWQVSSGAAAGEIAAIAIATADRPGMLQRCLSLVQDHCDRFGRRPRLLIVDGSRLPSHAVANRAIVAAARSRAFDAEYVGTIEALQLRCDYIDRGFDPLMLEFALTPGSAGANRNLLTLLTSGEPILMVDDDVRLEPWAVRGHTGEVSFRGHRESRAIVAFPSRAACLSVLTSADVDLLAAHSGLLGQSLASLVRASATEPDLKDACGHMLSGLAHPGIGSSVAVTMTGLAGDSGFHCPYRLLFSPPKLPAADTVADDALVALLGSREVHHYTAQPLVTHEPACMAYCMGLANQEWLPPFMPVGRNEDGVFGAMLAFVRPAALFGHLPYGIIHDSHRSWAYGDGIPSAEQVRISDLMFILVHRATSSVVATSAEARANHLAMILGEAGSLERADFAAFVMQAVLDIRSRELARADAVVATRSRAWRVALDRYRRTLFERLAAPDFFIPVEFRECPDPIEAVQEFLTSCGVLLRNWPDLVASQGDQPWSSAP